jgi:hypothetical protein
LSELRLSTIDTTARALIARKAASIAGDLRAALKICQSVIEMYRDHTLQKEKMEKSKVRGTSLASTKPVAILTLVKAAVDKYKETPFISMISRCCMLEKAILLCFCKHRKIVCGGDEHSSAAGMTMHMAWQRYEDLVLLVRGQAFYGSGGIATVPTTTSSFVITTTVAFSGPNEDNSNDSMPIIIPPMNIFQQTVQRLVGKGILYSTVQYRPCGRPVEQFHVNSSLQFSDFVAATAGDPLARFVSAT